MKGQSAMSHASVLLLLVTQLCLPLSLDRGSSRKGLNLWTLPTDQYQQHFELILKKTKQSYKEKQHSALWVLYTTDDTPLRDGFKKALDSIEAL